MIFDGTYDARQWAVVRSRQDIFHGSLFGALLPDDALSRLDEGTRTRLLAAAPNFDPTSPKAVANLASGQVTSVASIASGIGS